MSSIYNIVQTYVAAEAITAAKARRTATAVPPEVASGVDSASGGLDTAVTDPSPPMPAAPPLPH